MIKGNKKIGLITTTQILKQITGYDIYRYYFGNYTWRGDCFNLVQQIFNVDFISALRIIDKDFGLGICQGEIIKTNKVIWTQPIESIIKPAPFIQVSTRKPTLEELKYWDNYYLDESDLKEGNIYFPKQIARNGRRLPTNNLLTFCYWYPELKIWKIYRPHAPKREKNTPVHMWKWDNGGIPFDYCDGLKDIQDCHYGFLGKGRKDHLFLKKIMGICVADTQAEDPACINENTIIHLKENSKVQVCLFDCDKKGKETSWWLTNNHGFKHCNVPDKYVIEGLTDFPDWGAKDKYGEKIVIQHFQNKNYI